MNQVDVVSLIGPGRLAGRVALVTGCASGLGTTIAAQLAERGATVVVSSISGVPADEQLAVELPAASYAPANVNDPAAAARLVATTIERHGRLGILVNTVATADVIDGSSTRASELVLRVNVAGTWNVISAAAPYLRATGEGVIVNISSVVGERPTGSSIPYAACDAALNHVTTLVASALAPDIRVCSALIADPDMGRPVDVAATSHAATQPPEPCHGCPRALGTHRRRKSDPRFGWESLTTAERSVAEAVGAGLTNADAARRLFVSPYTVDYHLRQIFHKLGISSRVQLASLLAKH